MDGAGGDNLLFISLLLSKVLVIAIVKVGAGAVVVVVVVVVGFIVVIYFPSGNKTNYY